MYFSGSKPLTSAAILAVKAEGSRAVIVPTALLPVMMPFQNSLTVSPRGVTAPRPVTTTRRACPAAEDMLFGLLALFFELLLDVLDGVADRLDRLDFLVRNLDTELV